MASEMLTIEFGAMLLGTLVSLFIGSLVFFGMTRFYAIGEGFFIALAATFNLFVLMRSLSGKLSANALLIIPFLIGGLAFTRLTRFRWGARYTVAILSGVGAGVVFSNTIRAMIMSNIEATIEAVRTGSPDTISSWLIFIPMVVVPLAYTYSMRYSGRLYSGPGRYVFTLGRSLFMLYVGGTMSNIAGARMPQDMPAWVMSYVMRPIIAIRDVLAGDLVLT